MAKKDHGYTYDEMQEVLEKVLEVFEEQHFLRRPY